MPVPTGPPPGAKRAAKAAAPAPAAAAAAANPPGSGPVNDLLPFLDFVEHHPVGSSVNGVVESYSSHGAYVTIGDVRGYVPLRLMGDPPPRSAREMMKLGEAVTLVVTSFAPGRRSIDLSIPKVAPVTELVASPALEEIAEAVAPAKPTRKRAAKKAAEPEAAAPAPAEPAPVAKAAATRPARKAAAKKAPGRKVAAESLRTPVEEQQPQPAQASARKRAAKKAASPAPRASRKKAAAPEGS
jgi:hypothetical protein